MQDFRQKLQGPKEVRTWHPTVENAEVGGMEWPFFARQQVGALHRIRRWGAYVRFMVGSEVGKHVKKECVCNTDTAQTQRRHRGMMTTVCFECTRFVHRPIVKEPVWDAASLDEYCGFCAVICGFAMCVTTGGSGEGLGSCRISVQIADCVLK